MAELPLLTYAELHEGLTFERRSVHTNDDMVARYVQATGDYNPVYVDDGAARHAGLPGPIVPPGLAGVFARWSYLSRHRMPSGGVMAGMEVQLLRLIVVGERIDLEARVAELSPDHPKRKVVILSTISVSGETAIQALINARWPGERRPC